MGPRLDASPLRSGRGELLVEPFQDKGVAPCGPPSTIGFVQRTESFYGRKATLNPLVTRSINDMPVPRNVTCYFLQVTERNGSGRWRIARGRVTSTASETTVLADDLAKVVRNAPSELKRVVPRHDFCRKSAAVSLNAPYLKACAPGCDRSSVSC